MPRLPTAEDLGQRPVPVVPSGGISRLQLSTPNLGAAAQAEVQFGNVVNDMGNTLAALALREKQKTDEAQKLAATSQYQNGLLDMEYGQQNGFINIKGGDAVTQPLLDTYRTKREALAKQIRDGLKNPEQQAAFDNQAKIMDTQFDGRIYRHVAEQSNIYQDEVHKGVLATERSSAALNYDQPGQIEMSLLRTDMEIERKAKLDGITNPDVVNEQKRIAGTMIHANVIQQMLLQGKDSAAAAYYKGIKNELTPEAMVLLGSKVDAASVDGEATRGADLAWGVLGPKSLNDPVRMDLMEAWVRDKYKDDPRKMNSAIQDLRSRSTAFKDGQHEMVANNVSTVLDEYHNGADIKMIQTMPEYQALDGENRMKLRDYILANGYTEQQRARAQMSYHEGEKAVQGFSSYWELSNPQVLSGLSEKQILALEPVMGQKLTADLMESKRKLSNPSTLKDANIDASLFNTVAADAGLKPFEKNLAPKDKEYLGRLKNEVEATIDSTQRQTGRSLTRDEKEKLMRSMVDKKVMIDKWSGDYQLPAPVIRPDQRKDVYVPIEKVDSTWLKNAINYMRSQGYAPIEWDDEKIKRNMKGRLQRAYGISITGGSSDEGKRALSGEDE